MSAAVASLLAHGARGPLYSAAFARYSTTSSATLRAFGRFAAGVTVLRATVCVTQHPKENDKQKIRGDPLGPPQLVDRQ